MEKISSNKPRIQAENTVPDKGRELHMFKLHPSEMKLIQVIRAIEFGEIEGLKVENGLPVYYKGARKTCKLA
jgi:hypothetical protein